MKTLAKALAAAGVCGLSLTAQTNVLTQHNDIGRTGQNLTETILTPANVSSGNFGKLYTIPLDNITHAQPLYMSNLSIGGVNHSVVFAVTENDSVYAFDANNGGAQLWKASLLDAAHGAAAGATPEPAGNTCETIPHGVEGTPVIDPSTNTMYLVGKTFENNAVVYRIHALDITNGNEKFGGPTVMSGSVPGTGTGSSGGVLTFNPLIEKQMPSLLLVNGYVYVGFGSYCDSGAYHGWIMGYSASKMTQTAIWATTPNATEGAFWNGGAGLSADYENGVYRLFVASGNGSYDSNSDYGDSVIQLTVGSNGSLSVTGSFTPDNQAYLNQYDLDVGSASTLVLPDVLAPGSASPTYPHLAVQASKQGELYLLNRDNLGGFNASTNSVVQDINTGGAALYGVPAYFNGNVYYWATADSMRQLSLTNGQLTTNPILAKPTEAGNSIFEGATPSISANGASNGIVWAVDIVNPFQGNPVQYFYAFSAANVATTLWSSSTNAARDGGGASGKWAIPTVADGKVFLVSSGQIQVYGLLTFNMTASPGKISVAPGGSTAATIALSSTSGFTGGIILSAANLPAGVTATFAPGSGGNATATFSATPTAAAGTTNVTITGTSSTYTQTVTIPVTVGGLADFNLATVMPSSLSVVPGGSPVSASLSVVSLGGFAGSPAFSVTGVPSGVSVSFSGTTLTLSASSSAVNGVSLLTITGVSGSLVHSTTLLLTVTGTTGVTAVNLSNAFNVYGIFNDGSPVTNGGLANSSYAYSSNFLANSLTWGTLPFTLGQAETPSAVTSATVPLPAGTFGSLNLLASASFGPINSQSFIVTYTDGTTTTTTLNMSDWGYPQNFAGESIVASSAYRVSPTGAPQSGSWNLYGYSIPLNTSKTVKSITLPNNANVVVLAITLSQPAPAPFTVAAASPTFTLAPNTGGTLGLTVTPLAGFTGSVSLSLGPLPQGVSDAFVNVTATGATLVVFVQSTVNPGTYPLTVIGTSGNLVATSPLSLVVPGAGPAAQTITFGPIASQSVGASLTVSATASSGLPVSYSIVQNGNCSISGNVVTFLNVGNCGVIAAQAGNTSYLAAASVGQIIVVNQAAAPGFTVTTSTGTFTLAPNQGSTLNVTATPASGFSGNVTYTLSGLPSGVDYAFLQQSSTVATLVVWAPPATTPGTYTITVTGTSGTTTSSTTFKFVVT